MPKKTKEKFLKTLNQEEQKWLLDHPEIFMYDKQIISGNDWRWYVFQAGRGAGKTFAGSAWMANKVKQGAEVLGLVGPTHKDVIDVMVKAIIAWFPDGEATYTGGDRKCITFKNYPGVVHCTYADTDGFRGQNVEYCWMDEICKWCDGIPEKIQECFDIMEICVRIGDNPQVLITSTPKNFPIFHDWEQQVKAGNKRIRKPPVTTMFDNPFLSEQYRQDMVKKFTDVYGNLSRIGRQELYGELLEDIEGALWTQETLNKTRVDPDEFQRRLDNQELYLNYTLVSLDPAVTSKPNSDETGILVGSLGNDGHIYITQDKSCRVAPLEWAKVAIKAYTDNKANYIIAEINNGGDMVAATLKSVDSRVPVKVVHTSKGKVIRAEPVSSLWDSGKIHLVGNFKELEYQMTHFNGSSALKHDDRLDSVCYLVNEFESLIRSAVARNTHNLPSFL